MTRRPFLNSHLYGQIVGPLVAASVLVAVVGAVAAGFYLQDMTSKWATQVADARTEGVVQRFVQRGGEMHTVAKMLAEDDSVREYLEGEGDGSLESELASQAAMWPGGAVAVIDASGVVLASAGTNAPTVGRPLPGGLATSAIREPLTRVLPVADGGAGIFAAEPVRSSAGTSIVVIQPVNDTLLFHLAQGTEGTFSIYSATGKRLAGATPGALPSQGSLEAALEKPDPELRQALAGAETSAFSRLTIGAGGTAYRVTIRGVRGAGELGRPEAVIVGAVSEESQAQVARAGMGLLFWWSVLAVGGLVGLGLVIARRVSTPLAELAEGARRIADGDFNTKANVHGSNEIAVLGQSFNDMVDSLRERSDSLTKKVLELATLYEMSRALGSTLDLDELLNSTLDSALRIFDLDAGYIALRDRESGALEIRVVRGEDLPDERKGSDAVSASMAEWVVREGRPLIFNPDAAAVGRQVDALTGARAALCVPLVSTEGTIGAITVGSSDAEYRFNSDDVRLLSTIGNHVTIAIGNIELFLSLQEAYLATVRSLAAAVDAKDSYTRGHSDKVAGYATLIAQRMNLSHEQLTALEMAAYLHDIGKIGVSEEILLKPGRLSDDEMAQMRHHPLIGANILKPVAFPWAITPIVRHHHEYYDGGGYPAGLRGEEIPLLARILCVADSYEAITADRPYRAGRSAQEAVTELKRCAGTQFDPQVVEVMTDVVDELGRTGSGVLRDAAEEVSAEEARAIFSSLVDGVMSSFRRLGGPRLASNVEAEVDEYLAEQHLPYRMVRGRLAFVEDPADDTDAEVAGMRRALARIDEIIARVSGGTLVEHFYEDAVDGFSARMRKLAIALKFRDDE
jgi:putative nucleotidyltransferase with HDIG domain